jgi:sulfate transport system ATP-binding protein
MRIEAKDVVRRHKSFLALDRVSITAENGEFLALLGPSGSGKTTLLRIIAGLDFPDSGSVWFDGREATGLKVQERRVGFVFQNYALFRHMTVARNVAFGLEVKGGRERLSRAAIAVRVSELLRLVQLPGMDGRYPHELSGGQRQRVALARALAIEPRILLLDEPFGALDAKVRKELRSWVRQLQRDLCITALFVTHDQEEALEIADRVVVMNRARVEQVGTPEEVYSRPATPFVLEFFRDGKEGLDLTR